MPTLLDEILEAPRHTMPEEDNSGFVQFLKAKYAKFDSLEQKEQAYWKRCARHSYRRHYNSGENPMRGVLDAPASPQLFHRMIGRIAESSQCWLKTIEIEENHIWRPSMICPEWESDEGGTKLDLNQFCRLFMYGNQAYPIPEGREVTKSEIRARGGKPPYFKFFANVSTNNGSFVRQAFHRPWQDGTLLKPWTLTLHDLVMGWKRTNKHLPCIGEHINNGLEISHSHANIILQNALFGRPYYM